MRLGRTIARATVGIVGTLLVIVAGTIVGAALTQTTVTTLASATPWVVTVGGADRVLNPGVDATIPYEVANSGRSAQTLSRTAVEFRNDGVRLYDTNTHTYVDGCLASWFHGAGNTVPTGSEVAPGTSVKGTAVIAFDRVPVPQDACKNIGIEVIVTAE